MQLSEYKDKGTFHSNESIKKRSHEIVEYFNAYEISYNFTYSETSLVNHIESMMIKAVVSTFRNLEKMSFESFKLFKLSSILQKLNHSTEHLLLSGSV